MRIGIIVAMEKELQQTLALLTNVEKTECAGREFFLGQIAEEKSVVIMQCGIGKVNAALGTQEMINRYRPDCIVSSGVAGGATTLVPRLEVVASTEVVYHDVYCFTDNARGQIQGLPPRFRADERLVKLASGIEGVHPGLIASGDWFVDTKAKMGEILDLFPDALAVDMESGAIAHTCHLARVPFISFRIISDIPLASERGEQYFDFWDRIAEGSFRALAGLIEVVRF